MKLIKIDPIQFGLSEIQATAIANKFLPVLEEMQPLIDKYSEIKDLDPADQKNSKQFKELRLKLVKCRTNAAKIHKEEKAYFLGFAFGDGCNTYSNGYKFTMASIKDDIDIFLKFGELFPFVKVCKYLSHPKLVYLECYEKSFVKDLIKLGLLQNKKLQDLDNKFHIPNNGDEV